MGITINGIEDFVNSIFSEGPEQEEKLRELFGKYAASVSNGGVVSIASLAQSAQVPPTQALYDLQKLVARGFFGKDAYIDYLRKALVIPEVGTSHTQPRQTNYRTGSDTAPVTRIHVEREKPSQKASRQEQKAAENQGAPTEKFFKTPKILLLIGAIILLVFGGLGLGAALGRIALAGAGAGALLQPVTELLFGGACLGIRKALEEKEIRFRTYLTLVGDRKRISVKELAEAAGVSERRARADLSRMALKGVFGPKALVDRKSGYLLASPEDRPEQKHENLEDELRATGDSEFNAILKEIRQLNNEIEDYEVSQRIYHIEEVTSKIFRTVEEHPEKRSQIKSFMSYYLPTTLKLLRSYSSFEKQGIQGDNITAAKENIARILENLAKGYEQQLDQLFQADALDISTDINVLETMMKRDGLSDDDGLGQAFQAGQAAQTVPSGGEAQAGQVQTMQ